MKITVDDLHGPEIIGLLEDHLEHMRSSSPPESTHALDLAELKASNITFWSAWEDQELLGCGALKQLDKRSGEIKSMRTARQHVRKGVAGKLLQHIIDEAEQRGYQHLLLETGSMDEFRAARALYARFGFTPTGPFSDYKADPNSVYMKLDVQT